MMGAERNLAALANGNRIGIKKCLGCFALTGLWDVVSLFWICGGGGKGGTFGLVGLRHNTDRRESI